MLHDPCPYKKRKDDKDRHTGRTLFRTEAKTEWHSCKPGKAWDCLPPLEARKKQERILPRVSGDAQLF